MISKEKLYIYIAFDLYYSNVDIDVYVEQVKKELEKIYKGFYTLINVKQQVGIDEVYKKYLDEEFTTDKIRYVVIEVPFNKLLEYYGG
jgi:hypothetical protein